MGKLMKGRISYGGAGGMDTSIYDTQQKKQDIFNYVDNVFTKSTPNFKGSGNPFGEPLALTLGQSTNWTNTSPYKHTTGNTDRLSFNLTNPIISWRTGQYHLKFTITGSTGGSVKAVYHTGPNGYETDFQIIEVSATNDYGYYAPVFIDQSMEAYDDVVSLGFIPTSNFDGAISNVQLLPIDNINDYYKMPVSMTYVYASTDWVDEPLIGRRGSIIYKIPNRPDTPFSIKIDLVKGKTYWVGASKTKVEARFGKTSTDRTGPVFSTSTFTADDNYSYINFWALSNAEYDSYVGFSDGPMGDATVNNDDGVGAALMLNSLPLSTSGDDLVFNDKTIMTQNDLTLLKPKKIVLWSGTWSVNGVITLDLEPYKTLPQYLFATINGCTAQCFYLVSNDVRFGAVHYAAAAGVITWFAQINRNATTNMLTLAACGYVGHIPSSNHSAVTNGAISEIYTIGFTL